MRDQMKRAIAMLLSVLLLGFSLVGCGKTEETEEVSDDHIEVNATLSGQTLTAGAAVDDVFSLPVEYDKKLNPITTKSSLNQMVGGLVYDQIFEVDDNYNLSSRILDDWYFSDNGTLVLEVRDDIPMHDGTMLTAADVAYSISRVFSQGVTYYQSRLGTAYSSGANGTVYISGDYVNTMMPYRLTLPVIKYGSILEDAPIGSGPYMWSEDKTCLEKFESYEDAENLMQVTNRKRKEYHNLHCKTKWGDSRNYELSINSSRIGYEETADIIEDYIHHRFKEN